MLKPKIKPDLNDITNFEVLKCLHPKMFLVDDIADVKMKTRSLMNY